MSEGPASPLLRLLGRFMAICLLRAGPQDLPESRFLLALCTLAYALAGLLLTLGQQSLAGTVLLVVIDLVLTASLLQALLWARSLTPRLTRSLTAVFGCGALLETLAIPIVAWQGASLSGGGTAVSNGLLVSSLLLWLWLFWNLVVLGHILAQTLGTRFFIGMGLALVYTYLSINISRIVLGAIGG